MAQGAWGNGQWAWGNGHGAWGMGFSCFRYAVIVVVGCVPHRRSSSRTLMGGTHPNCRVRSARACAVPRVELAERTLLAAVVSRTLRGGTYSKYSVCSARACAVPRVELAERTLLAACVQDSNGRNAS